MNIGHDDGTELLEEEASDRHTEPQVRSFNMLEDSSSSLWFTDSPCEICRSPPQDCLWCSLRKSIDQR